MTYANGASQSDKNGNLLTETDALGNKVQYAYTPEGWLESITRADGTVLTFEYDKTGSLLVQNVGDGQTVESSYNEIGMVTEVSSAEGTIVYQYNGQGYLVSVTNVNGDKVSYTYDRMNRMTSVTGLDGDVTRYAYDAAGRRVETASSTLTTAYRYDSVGNLLTQATSGASEIAFSYSYNKNGYITGEVRTEGGKTTESTYAYDALGQLTSFLQSTGYEEQYAYDKAGNMTEKVLTGTDGIETALKMSYNKGNQLTTMVNGKDKIAYTYDKNGSMVTKVLTSQAYGKLTDAYAYNALDQLTEYVGYDGYQQEFTYDANGMRLSKSEVGNGNRSTLEELLRGNIAGLPEIVEPTQGQINADEADMPAGLEWATTEYLYDLTQEYYQVISETTTSSGGASSTTAYAYGLERIAAFTSDSRTSYVYDGRGSVAQAITAPVTGEAVSSALPDVSVQVQSFSYTAFGEQMGNVKVSGFSYNAEAYDAATGMLNLRARQYEPALGRFSQKDIVRGQVRSPLSLNRYIYCINNPINLIDPNGKAPNFSAIAMGGITAGAIAGVTAKKLKTSAAQVKTALRNLKNAITGGYNAAANSTDINVQKAYNQALKEISAAEKSNKKPLTDKEKNRIFAEACIVHSLQLSYEYGVSSSNAFTYDETIAIGKSVQSQYKAYSARQKKDTKANYCIKAIPHKERTTKRTKKMYNKEVKKQLTMSLISDELGQATTKKKEFLGIMEKLIPWSEWVGIVQPHYYKGERGNKPYDLELMLRIYVLQHLYNLADDAARNEIIDSRAFSQFCGVDSSNQVPDGDTIGRFRHILERNQLGEAFFTNVVESLQKCNLMLKKGTIVDSTLIAAPSSTKNKEKQRDPEAHSVKKGNQWYFGYKEHIGVDADSGLVHTLETTAANVHDSNMVVELLQGTEEDVYGDSGYLGAEKKDDAILVNNEGKPIRYQINKRPSQLKKASGEKFELLKAIEHAKSSVRSKVEHVFCVIKRIFHFCKTRFRGREKLHQHCCTLFALANLYLARNRMKVA